MKEVYLDNSATTRVCPEAAEAVMHMMCEEYGNPSSLHTKGFSAQQKVDAARKSIASRLKCSEKEIVFTSGGTEANNLAVFGAAAALSRRGKRIVTTEIEHASVYESVTQLEKQGFEVVRLSPDADGRISPEAIAAAITPDTILVSIMLVNNETGLILPAQAASAAIKRAGAPALLHCDAVQAFGKIPVKPSSIGADLVSISAHKIHGPKGVGALYIRSGARLLPRTYGGEQEKKIRPGTEASPLIAGFGAAADALGDLEENRAHVASLRDHLLERAASVPEITIHSPADGLCYIVSLSVEGIRSETMLHHLASRGVYVSSGSACSKGKKSHVMQAMHLSPEQLDSVVRVSFSRENTREDVDALIEGIADGLMHLARRK